MDNYRITVSCGYGTYEVIPTSEEDIKEQICKKYNGAKSSEEEEITEDDIDGFNLENWGDFDDYSNLQDIDIIYELFDTNIDNGLAVIEAAIACGIEISDIDEKYQGYFDSNADYTRDYADGIGNHDYDDWPLNCIDWEEAANDLDFDEHNGYYFRD